MQGTPENADSARQRPARVAVIVPGYGVAHHVAEALESLRAQTFPDWEGVVIDDGAPDDVAAAVAPFLADPRLRFLATANHGVSGARNRAVAQTTAPLLTLLDGDDLLRPDYLATMVPLMEGDPSIRLASCNARIFGAVPQERLCFQQVQGSDRSGRGTLADVLDRSFRVYIGSTFRRADFEAVGGFDEAMTHSEDFDFWVRLMLLGGHAQYVDKVLGDYRVRAGSASSSNVRLTLGNIRVYTKTLAALPPDHPARRLAERLIAREQGELAIETAITRVIEGDARRGLAELRAAGAGYGGSAWRMSMRLWRLFPGLARPMLRWRRQAHSRGMTPPGLFGALAGLFG